MFNIGGGEFLVIAVLALIVLGPQRLPDAARQVGKVMGEMRRLSSGFQQELQSALQDGDDPTVNAMKRAAVSRIPMGTSPLGKGLSAAVQAVSAQAPATPSAEAATPATKATPAKKVAANKKAAPAKKAAAKKVAAKKAAPAKKAAAKKAAPAKKSPATSRAAGTNVPRKRS
jgi:Tat protein translocase TatB subunit